MKHHYLGLVVLTLSFVVMATRAPEPSSLILVREGHPSHDEVFDGYVTFGDSLSDPGNHFAIFHELAQAPFEEAAQAPYDFNGYRFTNGPTWIEQLAQDLESGGPAFDKPQLYKNYAVGRARARSGSPVFSAHTLSTETDTFLADVDGKAFPQAKYMVWIGANDLSESLLEFPNGTPAALAIIDQAIDAIASNIRKLAAAGAREFKVLNIPDLGLAPIVKAHGPVAVFVASWLSTYFNNKLTHLVDQLHSELAQTSPAFSITLIDIDALLKDGVANNALNLEPCLRFNVETDTICSNPEERLFWDGIHPTTAGHRLIRDYVRDNL